MATLTLSCASSFPPSRPEIDPGGEDCAGEQNQMEVLLLVMAVKIVVRITEGGLRRHNR